MEDTKKISQEEILTLVVKAIENFKQLCIKFDNDKKKEKLNIVNNVIRRNGNSELDSRATQAYAQKVYSSLNEETKELLSLENVNADDKIAVLTNNIAIIFQNDAAKLKTNFSNEYNEAFRNASFALSKYKVVDERGKELPDFFNEKQEEGNEKQEVNEGLLATSIGLVVTMVVGSMVGNAITNTVKSSPAACSWVRNMCDKYPVASKVIDWFTWTDLEAIQNQDKLNKGEISPEELDGEEYEDEEGGEGYEEEGAGGLEDWFTPQQGEQALVTDGEYDMIEIDDNGNIINAHKKEE